jgi:hypothetical protein
LDECATDLGIIAVDKLFQGDHGRQHREERKKKEKENLHKCKKTAISINMHSFNDARS